MPRQSMDLQRGDKVGEARTLETSNADSKIAYYSILLIRVFVDAHVCASMVALLFFQSLVFEIVCQYLQFTFEV